MRNDLNILQQFLNQNTIPVIKSPPKTFLEITRQPHYENVITNLYAFYFDVNKEHGLEDLFIKSLIDCINTANKGRSLDGFPEFSVNTEYSTDKNGRIDLLLAGDDGTSAIVIENKIYHHLNNNLDDYWNTIMNEKYIADKSVGIVLSLNNSINPKHPKFINLTHLDFLDTVMDKIGSYLLKANDKHLMFLKDFYQNMKKFNKSAMDEKDLKFYFSNYDNIEALIKFREVVFHHIVKEIEKVASLIVNLNYRYPKVGSDKYRKFRYLESKLNNEVMITVYFEKLLTNDKKMELVLELQGTALETMKLKHPALNFTEAARKIYLPGFVESTNNREHIAKSEYPLNDDEIFELSKFISTKLESDGFLSLFEQVLGILTKEA